MEVLGRQKYLLTLHRRKAPEESFWEGPAQDIALSTLFSPSATKSEASHVRERCDSFACIRDTGMRNTAIIYLYVQNRHPHLMRRMR